MPSRAAEQQRQFVQYHQRVLATNPIAYWPLDERNGTVAYGWAARPTGNQNGTHVGVTLGQSGIGDGRTSPFYDGANDYTNVFTAALAAVFNGQEGAVLFWAKVTNAAVWTDATRRDLFFSQVDANNFVIIRKDVGNNQLSWFYNANGTTEAVSQGATTTTDWMQIGLTWSRSAGANGEVKAYFNGAQTGATQIALGNWAGAIVNATIGATNIAPANVWNGYIAHFAMWNRPITVDEIQQQYRARWS